MKFQPFAILTCVLAIGILIGHYFGINSENILWIGSPIFLLLLILKIFKIRSSIFTLLGLVLVCLVGIIRYNQVNQQVVVDKLPAESQLLQLKLIDIYKPSEKYAKYKTKVIKSIDPSLIGNNLLLYVKKSQPILHAQDHIITSAKLYEIPSAKNPHAFDYKRFMGFKGLHLQAFCDTIFRTEHPTQFSFSHLVSKFKQTIKGRLTAHNYSKASILFVSSLALGDRSGFDQEIQNTLSSVGIMHLFAISGLHIGMIFGVILVILYPLLYLKHGKVWRIILALVLIWFYAAFVNFTPSVTRAAFMISVYYATVLIHRPNYLIHTLFFTAFVLLCYHPNNLFDVGFQLSYAAVFFIAWLYRPIRNLLPKYPSPIKNYVFDLISITTAAQLGVMPISIFYFHQFSGLFILGNLLMIPLAMTLVILSMLVVFLVSLDWDFSFGIKAINFVFDFILSIIEYIASFEEMILRNLSISVVQLCILMMGVFLLRALLIRFKWHQLIPILGLILMFQLTKMYHHYQLDSKQELIVFNQYKGSIIGIRDGHNLNIFWQVPDSIKAIQYVIQPYQLKEHIDSIYYYSLNESVQAKGFIKENYLIKFKHNSFFIVEHPIDSLPCVDYIIGTKGKINTQTYIPTQIKRVVADASNYPSVIKRLEKNSDKIYDTATSGAFIFTTHSTTH